MALGDIILAKLETTVFNISKMKLPNAVDLAIIRAIQVAPAALRDWETRCETYLTRAIQLSEQDAVDGTPTNGPGHIYMPLVMWYPANSNFIADVLAVVQSDVTATVVLPSAYAELQTRINEFITQLYPDTGPHYWMLSTRQDDSTTDEKLRLCNETVDSEVDPANYTDDDDISGGLYYGNDFEIDILRSVNNLIYHTYLDDDAVDLTKGGQFTSLVATPICALYVIMDFLRNELPAGLAGGTFLSTSEMDALESAALAFLVNT
jgi:hypothetical protein